MPGPLMLNRYRLLENHAKGGFGLVDLAWDTRLQRRVAIKRIPLAVDVNDLPGIQEARTAALLNDPHIVSVLDFEVTGTEAMLIMEFVDGPTLGQLLANSQELLDLDTITAVIADVSAALEFAHENAVLHLDIKPDNILIDHSGTCKVTDFGLSELSGTAGFAEPEGGTIGYMPPEQLTMGEVDERTDQWALAILSYQLLTGANPFYGGTAAESWDRIRAGAIELPSILRPELEPALDEVLMRALSAERENRYPSVAEFSSELAPWLGSATRGRKRLKALVNEHTAELAELAAYEPEPDAEKSEAAATGGSLLGRLPERARGALLRIIAAAAGAATAWLGMSGLMTVHWIAGTAVAGAAQLANATSDSSGGSTGILSGEMGLAIQIGIVVFVALAALLVPQLGAILGLAVLGVGIGVRGYLIVAAVMLAIAVLWWIFVGRKGPAESVLMLLGPPLAGFGLLFALPLLAGWTLLLRRAWPTALAQALMGVLLAGVMIPNSLSLQVPTGSFEEALAPLVPFTQLATWLVVAFILVAALIMHGFAARGGIGRGLLATVLAAVALTLPTLALPLTLSATPDFATLASQCINLALSTILVMVLTGIGLPAFSTVDTDRNKEG
jgi:hypothetical protein